MALGYTIFIFIFYKYVMVCLYGDAGNSMENIIFFQSVIRGSQRPGASLVITKGAVFVVETNNKIIVI